MVNFIATYIIVVLIVSIVLVLLNPILKKAFKNKTKEKKFINILLSGFSIISVIMLIAFTLVNS